MAIIKEVEERLHVSQAPLDFDDRATDLAIAALEDIAECDESHVYVKWDSRVPQSAGRSIPLLYVLFRAGIKATAGHELPKVHMGPDGKLYPAHAICLCKLPSFSLMKDQEIKDAVRKGVESYLTFHKIVMTSM